MNLLKADFSQIDSRLKNIQPYLYFLNMYLPQFGIVTWQRLSIFFAQCFHECDFLNGIEEYASGSDYEGRKDLGNIVSGYGVKYKGRGWIHTTGFFNYCFFDKFARSLGINEDFVKNPEKLKDPHIAVLSAVYYWHKHDLNTLSDKLDFEAITKKINGGLTHLSERKATWEKTIEICKQIAQS
ncbi:hypothetical protein [Emticicia sp. W12TSBA100-4]|uniref:glycoside hydrolase family 19 protein n=1 Tax=Emticicia sp. W12TSBA100-4 TaxID=3160965 RepID=UPI0033067A68